MRNQSIISVKEARKLLGKDSKDLSDTQVEEIIETLKVLANKYLGKNGSKKTLGV